ncbi:SWIM zinc finger family protein [Paenibacillus sp. 481]|uniref:SWIM zinc finger family protein n=1 Tax=Paenibacillus sp. 481 TaxID=2835869 RepID=UPI001E29B5BA|nr:SWIM zinc finger family protein [Paenibacillus sp. 481]UHA74978.1 SWIM zinc finger family protein [Paenibacillus sp. 481]
MSQQALLKNVVNRLTEQIANTFEYKVLERGWRYYRAHAVTALRVSEMGSDMIVTAIVNGNTNYAVRIHSSPFDNSSCNCPYNDYCKHMAAVFFQLCAEAGLSPELYLSELRQACMSQERAVSAARKRALVKEDAERRKKVRQMSLDHSGTAEEWHQFFERKFDRSFTDYQSSVTEITAWVKTEMDREAEGMDEELYVLYRMHGIMYVLQQLSNRASGASSRAYAYKDAGMKELAQSSIEELGSLLTEAKEAELSVTYPTYVSALGMKAGELAFNGEMAIVDGQEVYALFWSTLLNEPSMLTQERDRLVAQLDEEARVARIAAESKPRMMFDSDVDPPRVNDAVEAALIQLQALLGEDEQAVERLARINKYREAGRYLGYLHEHADKKQYDKLWIWLKGLAPLIRLTRSRADVEAYWSYWKQMYEREPDNPMYESLAMTLMPNVTPYLSSFLIDKQRFRDWANVQILRRVTPDEIAKAELRLMQREAPELLLPLYHQAIERQIEDRSREQYRAAVKLLHELRELYAASGREPLWESYVHSLLHRYARLRALREELRKGALLP